MCEISGGTRDRESRDRGEFSGYQRYDSHRSNVLAVCSGDDGLRRINEVAVEINETGVSLGSLGIRVVSVLDSGAEGPGFKSQHQAQLGLNPVLNGNKSLKLGNGNGKKWECKSPYSVIASLSPSRCRILLL